MSLPLEIVKFILKSANPKSMIFNKKIELENDDDNYHLYTGSLKMSEKLEDKAIACMAISNFGEIFLIESNSELFEISLIDNIPMFRINKKEVKLANQVHFLLDFIRHLDYGCCWYPVDATHLIKQMEEIIEE